MSRQFSACRTGIAMLLVALAAFAVTAQANGQPLASPPSNETEAKRAILNSPEWQRLRHEFNEWLSVQEIYTPQQVAKLKADLDKKISSMTAEELTQFVATTQERLSILLGPEAQKAREWLGQYMAVASQAKIDELKKQYPDVARMTAEQLRQQLAGFEQQRENVRSQQAAFDQIRQQQVQANREYLRETQMQSMAAQRAAIQSAGRSTSYSYGAPYRGANTLYPTFWNRNRGYNYGIGFGFGGPLIGLGAWRW